MDNHKKLIVKDNEGNEYQVLPETDMVSVIGLVDALNNLQKQINEVNKALGRTNNRVLYH